MYGAFQTNIHLDILMGRDEVIESSDVFLGDVSHYNLIVSSFKFFHVGMESGPSLDPHNELQKKVHNDKM